MIRVVVAVVFFVCLFYFFLLSFVGHSVISIVVVFQCCFCRCLFVCLFLLLPAHSFVYVDHSVVSVLVLAAVVI